MSTNGSDASYQLFIPHSQIGRSVKTWLIIGLVMIFFQVVIGGVTRLTGSGLSITKWEIVTGSFPPMTTAAWNEEFDLYKATPQYQQINEGMTLSEFKFIYFWEYIHRLWARLMGFVFLIPFFFFWLKKRFSKKLFQQLVIVFFLAALVASFGWIMVASGLINRPWVNAYKLTMHLSLAFVCYSFLWWTTMGVLFQKKKVIHNSMLKRWGTVLIVLLGIQIILGGTMSGMKAGLFYPTWPDMNGEYVPSVILDGSQWTVENFVNYDKSGFVLALVQFLHRGAAYLLTIIGLTYFFVARKQEISAFFNRSLNMWITMLVIQVLLGIWTVISCQGSIPVDLGVYHQAGALLLLTAMLSLNFQLSKSND